MAYLNGCVWTPASAGTGSFVFNAAVSGFFSPTAAGAVNGETYNYTAEFGADREAGTGTFNTGTGTLTRTPVISTNSNAAVDFPSAPTVQMGGPLAADGWVTAAADFDDTAIIVADGELKKVKKTGVLIDSSNNVTGAASVTAGGVLLLPGIPLVDKSANYTFVLLDAQTGIRHPASDNNARVITIPANGSVAYPVGTCLLIVNEINTLTLSITTDTLVLAGTGATGSRFIAANGIAVLYKVASTRWYVSGTGIT